MTELYKSQRVSFPRGEQTRSIKKILERLSVEEAATICNCSERTIRDWRREKFSMDFNSLRKLCEKTSTPLPTNIELRDRWWYTRHGGSAGGLAIMKKYGRVGGNEEYRKKKWREWWEREGKWKHHPIINVASPINKPIISSELAEFVGIMLGDGGISKYQVTITLNREDDKEYLGFVAELIKTLFGITPGFYQDKKSKATDIVVSRRVLVEFCTGEIGLKIGNKVKQQVDIPDWIRNNRDFEISCVRGLIDTDGSIFTHKYKVNGKRYSYKKLAFSNRSRPLLNSVYIILQNIGLRPRLTSGVDVRLDSTEDMKKYFAIVGTNNFKHLKRYQN